MRFGRYETLRLLGRGGMSEVYEAQDVQLGSRHALKLFAHEKDDAEVRGRFLVEGRLLAHLRHPRVVKVSDVGTSDDGRPYFVMDLILDEQGSVRSLADVEPGSVDEEMVGRWYDDLREGLAYIHSCGVIHRDLKLQNVLIGPDEHAVLTDFGISKVLTAKEGAPVVDTVKTLVKMCEGRSLVMGSVGYMAPELEMGVEASPQSDYYALGVIIYRLLTGTWCDARTDVVGTLETYDPVWKRILPKLLHANPNGRECLSYATEKQSDRERLELEWEERWMREKSRGHLARHVARYVGFLLVVAGISVYAVFQYCEKRVAALRSELLLVQERLALPDFADVSGKPPDSQDDSAIKKGLIDRSQASYADAWILLHGTFDALKQGRISIEQARESVRAMAQRAKSDPIGFFVENRVRGLRGEPKKLMEVLQDTADGLDSFRRAK